MGNGDCCLRKCWVVRQCKDECCNDPCPQLFELLAPPGCEGTLLISFRCCHADIKASRSNFLKSEKYNTEN